MSLCVLNVAYPFASIGPDAVGGAEQIVTELDAALTKEGHDSVVMAAEGSETKGILISMPKSPGALDGMVRRRIYHQYHSALEQLLSRWRFDVIHMHGVDFYEYLPPGDAPVLATLHLPTHWYPSEIFRLNRPETYLHCVSASQQQTCPSCSYLLPEIENGVATERFDFRHAKRDFVMSLGRISPEKGFHLALDAAKRADVPMLLAGELFQQEAHENYFQREIVSRLDRARRFLGPVGMVRKRRLLSAARCLLVPSLVQETSSLVAMESLACGTPVIAFASGALADIVEHGWTGFLVENQDEMAEAIREVDSIDPDVCRHVARERFSIERTTANYFSIYQQFAEGAIRPEIPRVATPEVTTLAV